MKKWLPGTILGQLMLFTVLVGILPIVLVALYVCYRVESLAMEELTNSQAMLSAQYAEHVSEKLDRYREALSLIANNTVVLDSLGTRGGNPYLKGRRISGEVTKSLRLEHHAEVKNCVIYSAIADAPVFGSGVTMMAAMNPLLRRQGLSAQENETLLCRNPAGQPVLLRQIQMVDEHSYLREQLGLIQLDLNAQALLSPKSAGESGDFRVILFDRDGLLYDSHPEAAKSDGISPDPSKRIAYPASPAPRRRHADAESLSESGMISLGEIERLRLEGQPERLYDEAQSEALREGYTVYSEEIEAYGLRFLVGFDNGAWRAKKREVFWMVLPLTGVLLAATLAVALWYSRLVSAKVGGLLEKFRRAERGDFRLPEPARGRDQLDLLDRGFSTMLRRLEEMIRVNYIQKLENQETQLSNLRLQISPHFLYNTLETISAMAAVKEAYEICEMCEKLGGIFRYSLGKDNGPFVTVAQEMHHVQNYLYIQTVRHGSRFRVHCEIAPELQTCPIPRFVLQPIVENAIRHGICETSEGSLLEIQGEEVDGKLVIRVKDDGAGMSPAQLQALRASLDGAKASAVHGIGLRNVHQRLRLICGSPYGIQIESSPHKGSCFSLWMPLNPKSDIHP